MVREIILDQLFLGVLFLESAYSSTRQAEEKEDEVLSIDIPTVSMFFHKFVNFFPILSMFFDEVEKESDLWESPLFVIDFGDQTANEGSDFFFFECFVFFVLMVAIVLFWFFFVVFKSFFLFCSFPLFFVSASVLLFSVGLYFIVD